MSQVTKKELAQMIADSVTAAMSQALASGVCTPENLPAIISAASGNAAMLASFEIYERGMEEP